MLPTFRSKFLAFALMGVGCLLVAWLLAREFSLNKSVENASAPVDQGAAGFAVRDRAPASLHTNESVLLRPAASVSSAPLSTEAQSDFTGIQYFAELRMAVQKKDQARINAAFEKLAVHLEEHPGNLPGVMAAMKAENSPEMNACLARLAAIVR